jgi:hypothetical protein
MPEPSMRSAIRVRQEQALDRDHVLARRAPLSRVVSFRVQGREENREEPRAAIETRKGHLASHPATVAPRAALAQVIEITRG